MASDATGNGSAVVLGVGPGLGAALVGRFAAGGLAVAAAARRAAEVERIAGACRADGRRIHAYGVDARDEDAVAGPLGRGEAALGPVRPAVYNAASFPRASILDLTADQYRGAWETCCFGGFLFGREAAKRMAPRGTGTILFTGATASLRGGAQFAAFASGKFALRALAQSMARELQPKGLHIAHVVIDGGIDTARGRAAYPERFKDLPKDAFLAPEAIAEAYWQLHQQPKSAWSHEIDLRPWVEKF